MNLKVYIETYGCQMNINDSEVAMSILCKEGCTVCKDIREADVILVNTCSVRDNAEQRILGRLEVFNQERKKRKELIVGVLGCMAQRLREKLLENKNVDFTLGPDSYRKLPEVIEKVLDSRDKLTETVLSLDETYSDVEPVRMDSNGVSAFISIARGCNNMCSYCIVPFTRGRERSRDPKSIVAEAEQLFRQGYKEVTLLGQNVDSYLWVNPDNPTISTNFYQLLEMVALVSPDLRVRFQTSHPKDIRRGVLYTMAMYPNICNHIHLPVQSGSDAQLKKMNRKYTRAEYLEKVAAIREILPDCAITTDIIAGFCDETEEDHRQTLSLMQEVGYDSAFMFYYSQRPNTLAARKFPDNVPLETKTRRLNEIIELQNKLSLESNKKDIGSIFDVLVEGVSKRSDKQMMGRNKKNKMCIFDAEGVKPGDIVSVKITECTSATLKGVIVPPKKPLIDKDSLADWKEMKERFRLRREEFENELKKSLEEIEQKREAHRKNRKSTDEEK